jgi:hypothetical protein
MSLPKLEIPVYSVKLNDLNKTVKYRPYTVKEEKALLMALESKDEKEIFETSIRCCDSCLITDSVKIEDVSLLDLETLIISIRSKSVGESVKFKATCESCKKDTDLNLDLTEMKCEQPKKPQDEIMLDGTYGVKLKSPSLEDVYSGIVNGTDDMVSSILSCIDFVYDKETTYTFKDYTQEEKVEFIENLSLENVKEINDLFIDRLPKNVIDVEFKCPHCGAQNEKRMDNLIDFFT